MYLTWKRLCLYYSIKCLFLQESDGVDGLDEGADEGDRRYCNIFFYIYKKKPRGVWFAGRDNHR